MLDVHALVVERLLLRAALLVRDARLAGERGGDDVGADVRRLGHAEEDAEAEDAEEDGAHPEGPVVAQVLDDVARDEARAGDAAEQEEVPRRQAGGALVHEVEVGDGGLDEDLVGGHAEGADDAGAEEAAVALGHAAPDGDDEHDERGEDVDGPLAVDLGERVHEEDADAEGEDEPGGGLREHLDGDAQLGGDGDEARAEHGAVGADDGGRHADDEEDHVLLPRRPVEGVVGAVRRLRHEQDVGEAAGAVFEAARVGALQLVGHVVLVAQEGLVAVLVVDGGRDVCG